MPADVVGLVEAATSEMLGGNTDWALNMQLVDLLQQTPQDCVAAIETLKPRLRSKKHTVGLNAVVLLEALVKNVPAIHELVGTRDFMEATLVKSLPRSVRKPNEGVSLNSLLNEPSDIKSPQAIARWEATLKCIQAWSLAFGPQSRYTIFHEVHRMLERRGVKFPPGTATHTAHSREVETGQGKTVAVEAEAHETRSLHSVSDWPLTSVALGRLSLLSLLSRQRGERAGLLAAVSQTCSGSVVWVIVASLCTTAHADESRRSPAQRSHVEQRWRVWLER